MSGRAGRGLGAANRTASESLSHMQIKSIILVSALLRCERDAAGESRRIKKEEFASAVDREHKRFGPRVCASIQPLPLLNNSAWCDE